MNASDHDPRPLAIALMGPTAAGKSALAMEWAERLGGGIVSVDSAQVYRGLDIGSAKPGAVERARVPHRLIDIREPWQTYSAAEFATDALAAMHAFNDEGRIPILVGGTGLYFRALFEGLSPLPAADAGLRALLRAQAEVHGWQALHAELERIDPHAADRIAPGDRQRIVRALEIWRLSGRPLSAWQSGGPAPAFPFRVLRLALVPRRRGELHTRIAERLDAMLAAGFLDEVARLRSDPRLDPGLPALRTVGYRQAWACLEGRGSRADFRERALVATRQLAKRQLTWLRGEPGVRWLDPVRERAELETALELFLARP